MRPFFIGRHGQQGAVALVRTGAVFLYLPLTQRHHLPQTFLRTALARPCFFLFRTDRGRCALANVVGKPGIGLSQERIAFPSERAARFARRPPKP